MAKRRKPKARKPPKSFVSKFLFGSKAPDESKCLSIETLHRLINLVSDFLFSNEWFSTFASILVFIEVLIHIYILSHVPYTNIDFNAYMQQAEHFIDGTLNYSLIRGDTGPLVYPAGHLYIYTMLYHLTNGGELIFLAQIIFAIIYILNISLVFLIYSKVKHLVPPYTLVFMCLTSYRIHSLYSLRLFNDGIAMLYMYTAIYFLIERKWMLSSIFYSLAVSVKMNILLFAPGILLIWIESLTFDKIFENITCCATIQVALGLPFLLTYPIDYLRQAFDFSRVFLFEWTVNWRFLGEEIFLDRKVHILLLLLHLTSLGFFFGKRYYKALKNQISKIGPLKHKTLTPQAILYTLFTCNFIGVMFARSLHYQFYIWYYHSLLFLTHSTRYKMPVILLILGVIERSWCTYPSTELSSFILFSAHVALFVGLWDCRHRFNLTKKETIVDHKIEKKKTGEQVIEEEEEEGTED